MDRHLTEMEFQKYGHYNQEYDRQKKYRRVPAGQVTFLRLHLCSPPRYPNSFDSHSSLTVHVSKSWLLANVQTVTHETLGCVSPLLCATCFILV